MYGPSIRSVSLENSRLTSITIVYSKGSLGGGGALQTCGFVLTSGSQCEKRMQYFFVDSSDCVS